MVTFNMSSGSRKSNIFGGVLFLVIGLGIATWGMIEVRAGKASQNWPTVEGRVTHSEVDRHRETRTSNNSTRRSTKYTADIRYSYVYEGTSYSGKRVGFGGTRKGSSSMANQIVRRYPIGKSTQVYVNPAKPTTACLEPGVSGMTYLPLGLGAIFAVVGTGVLIGGVFRS